MRNPTSEWQEIDRGREERAARMMEPVTAAAKAIMMMLQRRYEDELAGKKGLAEQKAAEDAVNAAINLENTKAGHKAEAARLEHERGEESAIASDERKENAADTKAFREAFAPGSAGRAMAEKTMARLAAQKQSTPGPDGLIDPFAQPSKAEAAVIQHGAKKVERDAAALEKTERKYAEFGPEQYQGLIKQYSPQYRKYVHEKMSNDITLTSGKTKPKSKKHKKNDRKYRLKQDKDFLKRIVLRDLKKYAMYDKSLNMQNDAALKASYWKEEDPPATPLTKFALEILNMAKKDQANTGRTKEQLNENVKSRASRRDNMEAHGLQEGRQKHSKDMEKIKNDLSSNDKEDRDAAHKALNDHFSRTVANFDKIASNPTNKDTLHFADSILTPAQEYHAIFKQMEHLMTTSEVSKWNSLFDSMHYRGNQIKNQGREGAPPKKMEPLKAPSVESVTGDGG